MATLVLMLGPREMQRLPITANLTTIGRDLYCDLSIDNPSVSRRHARIECQGGKFVVFDTSSQNGIIVDGDPVRWANLKDGSEIQIGKFIVRFQKAGGLPVARLRQVTDDDDGTFEEALGGTTQLDAAYMAKLRGALEDRHMARKMDKIDREFDLESRALMFRHIAWIMAAATVCLSVALAYLMFFR